MMTPCESTYITVQGQGAFGTEITLEDRLEVARCRKLCDVGRTTDAADSLRLLVQRGFHVDRGLFYHVLKRCIIHKDLLSGRRIHALTVKSGYAGDEFLATHLIGMYGSHGRLEEAMRVFTNVSSPDAYNWATIILACARHGEAAEAIRLYRRMVQSTTVKPDDRIYSAVLKACAAAKDLAAGKEVHCDIIQSPSRPDIFVQMGLVDMYIKCGSLKDARRMFDKLPERNVVMWNAMLASYAQQRMGQETLSLFNSMQQEGLVLPNSVTYVCLLQACACEGTRALEQGKQLHSEIEERGLQADLALGGSLVNMYAKCGSLEDARCVFDRIPDKNVLAWNAMLAGYVQQGMGKQALGLYNHFMQQEGQTPPNSVTYVCLLQACASCGARGLEQGKQLHANIEDIGLQDDVILGGSLVSMYVKCGSLETARSIFDKLPARNVVSWTAMIAGYAQQGMGQEALFLYNAMQQEGHTFPNSITYMCLLQACASEGVGALNQGKHLHAEIEARGLQGDVVLGGSLVNMYAKCGSLHDARSMFDGLSARNVVSWTAMIAAYAQHGMGEEALGLYNRMQEEGITPPDLVTCVCLLQACASVGVGALHLGNELHSEIEAQGLQDDVVLGGCLVNMYAKCSSLSDARSMFDKLVDRNVVTWNGMIAAYAQRGMGQEAVSLFGSMQEQGVTPDSVTFVCLLQACGTVAALPLGKQLHAKIVEQGLQTDPIVGTSLVNMYAKCGSMFDSQHAFDSLPERPIEAWGALTSGYSRQGDSEVVFQLVDRMRLEGIRPDGITFLSVLTVCSHVGLVEEGRKYFLAMRTDYGINPTLEHYICMIDLLGRAGHLDEALWMAQNMTFPPNSTVWRTLLGACRKWNNVEIGQQAFDFAVSADGKDAAAYVLMSDIYAGAQMWEAERKCAGVYCLGTKTALTV